MYARMVLLLYIVTPVHYFATPAKAGVSIEVQRFE